ncbi:MAG TPA: deoxyribonuclease V [Chloroflexota bacterium]|nr:deoxyribonuclease V [Chloroflexota bacterium]
MELRELNAWDVSPGEARAIQSELAPLIIREGEPSDVRRVAGVDSGLPGGNARAAVVVDQFPDLTTIETTTAECPLTFPYVPGLLSFREMPAVVQALRRVQAVPDLLIVDGQGIAHPRHFGIACHIGLIVDLPTIGCAKSILVGRHDPVGDEVGDWQPLIYKDEVVGAALRTKVRTNPVYVSIGNRISLESAIEWILACGRGYRLPEPQRQAHRLASEKG